MGSCIVWGCGSKNGKHEGLGLFQKPKIITDQGEEYEELTRKRRERSISKSWRLDREEYPRDRKRLRSSFSLRRASEGLRSVQSRLGTFPKFRKERIWASKGL